MVSVVQFEPVFNDPDPYGRTNDRNFPPVTVENDINDAPEYEIERLIKTVGEKLISIFRKTEKIRQ